jgi:hypothetical protein
MATTDAAGGHAPVIIASARPAARHGEFFLGFVLRDFREIGKHGPAQ